MSEPVSVITGHRICELVSQLEQVNGEGRNSGQYDIAG
jgi:hypothetical protein